MLIKRMVGLVAPFQRHHIFGQMLHQLRMLHDDVAPELHYFAMLLGQLVNLGQELQIRAAHADFFHHLFAGALAQVHRFVAAHVHHIAAEVRQHLIQNIADQVNAAGVNWVQRKRLGKVAPACLAAVGRFGQVAGIHHASASGACAQMCFGWAPA